MSKNFKKVFFTVLLILMVFVLSAVILRGLFPRRHKDIIEKYCEEYKTDINLVLALIKAESNFITDAVSHADAKGIMQITDKTFDFCNDSLNIAEADIFSPEDNIRAGVWYLSYLLKNYDNNVMNSVAAYNAGLSNVDKWLKDPRCSEDGKNLYYIPFEETQKHVDKIKRYIVIYNFLY